MSVVRKYVSGLQPIHSLKQFGFYIHIATFKIPSIRQMQHLIQEGNYASLNHKDVYFYIPFVKHHFQFFAFCLAK